MLVNVPCRVRVDNLFMLRQANSTAMIHSHNVPDMLDRITSPSIMPFHYVRSFPSQSNVPE